MVLARKFLDILCELCVFLLSYIELAVVLAPKFSDILCELCMFRLGFFEIGKRVSSAIQRGAPRNQHSCGFTASTGRHPCIRFEQSLETGWGIGHSCYLQSFLFQRVSIYDGISTVGGKAFYFN